MANNPSVWSWIRMGKDWGKYQFVAIEYFSTDEDRGIMRAQFERHTDCVRFVSMMNGEGTNNAKE